MSVLICIPDVSLASLLDKEQGVQSKKQKAAVSTKLHCFAPSVLIVSEKKAN